MVAFIAGGSVQVIASDVARIVISRITAPTCPLNSDPVKVVHDSGM
jgi:hypothetical protein